MKAFVERQAQFARVRCHGVERAVDGNLIDQPRERRRRVAALRCANKERQGVFDERLVGLIELGLARTR